MNQWLIPLKCGTGSNLVDAGRAAVRVFLRRTRETTPKLAIDAGQEATGEGLRRTRGEAAAAKLDAHPVDRIMVNVEPLPESPSSPPRQGGDGQARRRLMSPGWDGVLVVVRGRESRPHGEGGQRVRSRGTGMAGGRR